jgi:hypothetical protein
MNRGAETHGQNLWNNNLNSPLKNWLKRHRDVVPNFSGSQRVKKIVRLAEAPLANR